MSQAEAKKFVLVQEDAPQIARIIAFKLDMEGHEVEITIDGDATIEKVANRRPDLLILVFKYIRCIQI